jgi:sugar lactone lactonase YvrE
MGLFAKLGPEGHFYEGPRWRDGAWWVSDFYGHRVLRIEEDGTATTVVKVPSQPSGLGWLPDGSLLVVSMRDRRVLRLANGRLTEHADLSNVCPGWANDMCVTSSGIAYVGNFGFDLYGPHARTERTCLVMVRPDGGVHIVAEDLAFPNGCMVTADGSELIVNETLAGRHTAFAIAPDGTLSGRRVWAQVGTPPADPDNAMADLSYAPDGGCLDPGGRLWVADTLGRRVVLVAEGGAVLREIGLPDGLTAFSCCLGGPDETTLLIAAAPDHDPCSRSEATESVLLLADVSDRSQPPALAVASAAS